MVSTAMYKGAQDKQDWMARVGSHSTRERLSANIIPRADFERGALPELKDELGRLRTLMANHPQNSKVWCQLLARKKNAEAEIKRLNRIASESHERHFLYKAMKNVLTEAQFEKVSAEAKRLRMEAAAEE